MKILLAAVGHLKQGPEKNLFDQYRKRLTLSFHIQEIICRKSLTGDSLKLAEGELLLDAIPQDAVLIALDERGDSLTSLQFSDLIQTHQNQGCKTLAFCIGGADGLSDAVRKRSQKLISFGKLTWPHMLVRVLLMEQIYRSQQILSNHPYHRN